LNEVSVVVVSYNAQALLRECLASVAKVRGEGITQLIVVDNASSDGSREMVAAEFPWVKLVVNGENEGFARATNRGVESSDGQNVLLLNSDAMLLPGTVRALVDRMYREPLLGICGPALLNQDGSRQPSWGMFPTPIVEYLFQSYLFKLVPTPFPYGRKVHPLMAPAYASFRLVDWVSAAAMLVSRQVFSKVGLLPEDSFMYGEDLEFCFRARSAGFMAGYDPAGRVIHAIGGSRMDHSAWIANYTQAMLTYFSVHYPAQSLRSVARAVIAGSHLRRALWLVVGAMDSSRKKESVARARGYERAIALARTFLSPTRGAGSWFDQG
jgi:GT2 family glycosyltransferase